MGKKSAVLGTASMPRPKKKNEDSELDPEVEEVMQSTELGQTLEKYRLPVIAGFVAVILAIIVGSGVWQWKKSSYQDGLAEAFRFQTETVQPFLKGEKSWQEIQTALTAVKSSSDIGTALYPHILSLTDKLVETKDLNNALSLLVWAKDQYAKDDTIMLLNGLSLSALYEDTGDYKKAVSELESLTKRSMKVMEAKIYLDLGRLYKKLGDTNKAKLNFNYLLSNYPTDDLAKIAKVFLGEME